MKIELEISEENEATSSPWWVIIDPRQNFKTNDEGIYAIASLMIPFVFDGKQWTVSLYTKKEIDCSEIAKKYGGGGHKKAAMVTGPFFSREEAENTLKRTRYNYGKGAKVFCMSGCYTIQYADKVKF